MKKNRNVYLDGAANTPLDRKVYKAMKPYLKHSFVGNSAAIHNHGIKAYRKLEECRKVIADCLKVDKSGVYFTSGATESNNWVINSLAFNEMKKPNGKKHIIVSAIEHKSVLSVCKRLESFGFKISYVYPHQTGGYITVESVEKLLTKDTLLVCVMGTNNETGSVSHIESIAQKAHEYGALMLSDCTQHLSVGGNFIKLGERNPSVDYFTFSSHKIYGPTGVGCLIVQNDSPIFPLLLGGSQEKGIRAGTSNLAGIVGMAKAVELLCRDSHADHYYKLYCHLFNKLYKLGISDLFKTNGEPSRYNIISLNCTKYINCKDQLASRLAAYGISVSAGSACDADNNETDEGVFNPSHVLVALGLPENEIRNTIRISFTKYSTCSDIDHLIKALIKIHKDINGG